MLPLITLTALGKNVAVPAGLSAFVAVMAGGARRSPSPRCRRRGKLWVLVDVIHIYHQAHHSHHADAVADAIRMKSQRTHVVVLRDEDAFRRGIGDAEVLFTSSSPPRGQWKEARRLRLVQMLGVGVELVLPAPDLRSAVPIACLRGVFATEVAEHVFAMALSLVRGLPSMSARQRERDWHPFASGTLSGKTMGVLGYGAIGKRIASLAEAFGMKVTHTGKDPLDDIAGAADVLVVCLPKTERTTNLVDRRVIALLKRGAFVINVARGGIVDESALLDALMRGEVGGAALDVFDEEPLPSSSKWWSAAPNTIITPHIAGLGLRYVDRAIDVLLENVRRLEANEELLHLVDREKGY